MRRFDNEDGATAVVVALSLLVLMSVGALAVDAGSLWSTKRDFHGGTDAAALAAGRHLYPDNCSDIAGATDVARDVFGVNVTDADLSAVALVPEGPCGKVTVTYTGQARMTFASVVGFNSLSVYADTTVSPGDFVGGGLRPLSICMDDPSFVQSPSPLPDRNLDGTVDLFDLAAGDVLRLEVANTFRNSGPAPACGSAAGNWGWTCFDDTYEHPHDTDRGCDGNNSANNLADMLLAGYGGEVDLGSAADPSDHECQEDGDPVSGDCEMTPGSPSSNAIRTALRWLIDQQLEFPILGMTSYCCSGENGEVVPAAFIGVRMTAYATSGSSAGIRVYPGENANGTLEWIEFVVANVFEDGSSALATDGTLDRTPPVICGVDHQPGSVDYCER